MLNGDISNRVASTVAIRVEDNLIKYKEDTIKDKVLNYIVGKEKRAELNPKVVKAIYYVFKHTDMSIDLYIQEDNLKDSEEISKLIKDIPYNRLVPFQGDIQIAIDLNSGEIDYFVDDNQERRSTISHNRVISLNELYLLIR